MAAAVGLAEPGFFGAGEGEGGSMLAEWIDADSSGIFGFQALGP